MILAPHAAGEPTAVSAFSYTPTDAGEAHIDNGSSQYKEAVRLPREHRACACALRRADLSDSLGNSVLTPNLVGMLGPVLVIA